MQTFLYYIYKCLLFFKGHDVSVQILCALVILGMLKSTFYGRRRSWRKGGNIGHSETVCIIFPVAVVVH